MSRCLAFLACAAAAATLTAAAAPATPIKRLVWVKTAAAWTAAARTHGAGAVCDRWAPDALSLECVFTDGAKRWSASIRYAGERCSYTATYAEFRDAVTNRQHLTGTEAVPYCAKRWWLRLLSPWAPSVAD